jgi:hypothetical protein
MRGFPQLHRLPFVRLSCKRVQFSGSDSLNYLNEKLPGPQECALQGDQPSKQISGNKRIAGVIDEELLELSVYADGLPNSYRMRGSTYRSG